MDNIELLEHYLEEEEKNVKHKFSVGDLVIGNDEASRQYKGQKTVKGWIGIVMNNYGDRKIKIRGVQGYSGDFKALSSCFDLFAPAKKEINSAPMVNKKEIPSSYPLSIERDLENKKLFILESELSGEIIKDEPGELTPHPYEFRFYTKDQRTLETLDKIVTAVQLNEPCLLEGDTATSKTSSIRYLGMLTNNEVIRVNLNGQTDTPDLIGKFAPSDGKLQMTYEQFLKNPELLSDKSKEIIEKAKGEKRGLTLLESQKFAELENLKTSEWRWINGKVPDAMINGKWLILDEVNLAEGQIKERLNSVIEDSPSLTLTEHEGEVIGRGGDYEIHPSYRIFATKNPASFIGRFPMSPAEKNRWTSYKFIENPTSDDYLAMMTFMVYGKQPEVKFRGKTYRGELVEPFFKKLNKIPNFESFLIQLAKFHSNVVEMARINEIGRSQEEKYIFTRRELTKFFEYLESKQIVNRSTKEVVSIEDDPKRILTLALEYYYLDKAVNIEDKNKIKDKMDAGGISNDNWTCSVYAPKKNKI